MVELPFHYASYCVALREGDTEGIGAGRKTSEVKTVSVVIGCYVTSKAVENLNLDNVVSRDGQGT